MRNARGWLGVVVLGVSGTGCEPLSSAFLRTDDRFTPRVHASPPVVLLDTHEVAQAAAFHVVGLLEVKGMATHSLDEFLGLVQRAGAEVGCDVLVQRGAYVHRPENFQIRSGLKVRRANGSATWQFFCGATGPGTDPTSEERALTLARV